jgi:hypothetical protein
MIEKTYSQIGQDLFVKRILQEKTNGLFLDIGGAWPIYLNNTYLLEKDYNWTGASIELESVYEPQWIESGRKSKFFVQDALTADYDKIILDLLTESNKDRIDYLSVDLEPPIITLQALKKVPLTKFRFSVITFEHDMYRQDPGHNEGQLYTMKESRNLLYNNGYRLVFANMQEDWWVDSTLFSDFDSYISIDSIPQDTQYT